MSNAVKLNAGNDPRGRRGPLSRPSSHCPSFRRGSALMVSLALLLMLAVFAALFLTSSRYDADASAADLDSVRMDLYAEGLFQYVQTCMVAGLWGFDDKPLNNDGVDPYPVPAGTPPTGMPGPDSPFDYFGGEVLVSDPDGSVAGTGTRSGDETFFYPNFWLTDPRVQIYQGDGSQVFLHAAFAPAPNTPVPFYNAGYATSPFAQWIYADLDADGRADTPWLFFKPLGNGLYIRAAVRVEDTSSRVNVNVANHPIPAGTDAEALAAAVYPGYPADYYPIGTVNTGIRPFGDEIVGGFLSELNLQGMLGDSELDQINRGDGANVPGRYGKLPTTARAWPHAPDAPDIPAYAPPSLRLLLGDTSTRAPGRLGVVLGTLLDPALAYYWTFSQATFDPDGLARRLGYPDLLGSDEQDHAFNVDETFDLMSLLGYTMPAGLPTQTRLERLYPHLSDAAAPLPWRRLLTTYSWTLNLCPYGVDPYGDKSFRKVNLNTCTAEQLRAAIAAANDNSLVDGVTLTDDQMDQLAVNFIAYRNRPMTKYDLAIYLMSVYDRSQDDPTATTTTMPPPAYLEWDPAAWNAYLAAQTLETTKTEEGYLQALHDLRQQADREPFWTEITSAIAATPSISPARVPVMNRTVGGGVVYGLARSPYITEVWRNIQYPADVTQLKDPTDATKTNDYAIELYNPWDTPLALNGWYLRVRNSAAGYDIRVDLSPAISIAPRERLVVRRQAAAAAGVLPRPDLIVAMQRPTIPGLIVELLYPEPGGSGSDFAIFDAVPEAELVEFAGGDPASPVANSGAKYRRDDSGFWCYQRWYTDENDSLGAANPATPPDDPWTVATYGPNPAVPAIGVGQILSPAEIALVPYDAPRQVHDGDEVGQTFADATQSTDITSEVNRLSSVQFARPMLFHRSYTQPTPLSDDPVAAQSGQFSGVMQALLDFVTAIDFAQDGIDNNGDGNGKAGIDLTELRIPGRLNINTITDAFVSLDGATGRPLLPLTNPLNPWDAEFWRQLIAFRDLADSYATGRGIAAVGPAGIPGYAEHPGIEQLGELCNLQLLNPATNEVAFQGFWQDRDTQGDGNYLLPAQHLRRFHANANLLSVRSDTYMVTIRVEVVRPVWQDADEITRIDRLSQKEFMYLVDRSYCAKAPQQAPSADSAMNGRVNPDFVPPRVWRMTVPRYPAYGG